MKTRYGIILIFFTVVIFLSGFKSESSFPAPIKEPAAAIYFNMSYSGIFDNENKDACEEIAENVANICKFRNAIKDDSKTLKTYKDLCKNFLKESIVEGFLKIYEVYFYYKDNNSYALIAKGKFDLQAISKKINTENVFDENNKLVRIYTSIDSKKDNEQIKESIVLQANEKTLIICPKNSFSDINKSLNNKQNLLGDNFKTFENMIKNNPIIGAEINIKELLKNQESKNIPKSLTATSLVRLFIAQNHNKLQINIPKEEDRSELKKELKKQTATLNSIFENKTDYRLKEGKTSLFIESETSKEQIQVISRKAMAFILHFFVITSAVKI